MPYDEVGDERISASYLELTLSSDRVLHASGYLLGLRFSKGGMLPCSRHQLFTNQMIGTLENQVFQNLREIERYKERSGVNQSSQQNGENFEIHFVRGQREDIIGLAMFDQHRTEDAVCFLTIEEVRHQKDMLCGFHHTTSARDLD
jgi:hypothetical protein